jgi:glycosyltransferase involved in cell wall biosynthesis
MRPQEDSNEPTARAPSQKDPRPFSVVIPAYNEENGITPVLEELKVTLAATGAETEILVVDDGSTDKTLEAAEKAGVRVVRHEENRGYGAALKTGFRSARYDHVVITDADGTYPSEALLEMLPLREDHEMVVGARTGQRVHIPLIRRPAKWSLNKLANYLARRKIPDLNSGLRVIHKTMVEEFIGLLPDGFSFTTTITLALIVGGYRVKFLPIDYHHRTGKSKIRPIRDTLNFVALIVRTVVFFNPLRVFAPLALLFILGGAGVLVGSWLWLPRLLDTTTALLVLTGVQIFVLGLLADVIARQR